MKRLAVIGGGVSGLAAAKILREKGHEVTVYEKLGRLGGLGRTFKIGETRLECFYHHIFKTDTYILRLIKAIGAEDKLIWRVSPMGFFSDGKIWPFGGPKDLLTYKPLPFLDRLKFGFMTLYLQKKDDWSQLEKKTVEEWVSGTWGAKSVFKKVWEPLLIRKFGPGYETATAAWLWGRVNPRSKSRTSGVAGKEELGYMKGSFEAFHEGFGEYLKKTGVDLKVGVTVSKVERKDDGTFDLTIPEEGVRQFDAVVYTGSMDNLCDIAPQLPETYKKDVLSIRYQGCICLVLELKKPLSPIYWLNIADRDIPFGGVIEQTNFLTPADYGGSHVVYVFNYLENSHRYYEMGREELLKEYTPGLKKMFPHFSEDLVIRSYAFKDQHATPAYLGMYSQKIPKFETPIKGLYLGCTAQIYPEDRNMSNAIHMGEEAAELCLKGL